MSPILKVITVLQWGSLEFLEITKRPLSPSPTSLLCSRRRPPTAPPPASWRGFPAINSPRAGTHASRRSSCPACCLALEHSRPSHAPRRFQSRPGGRHLAVAVDSRGQLPPHPSSKRPSATRTPEVDFVRPFALSSLPRLRTPPPPRSKPRRAHLCHGAASPPLLRPR